MSGLDWAFSVVGWVALLAFGVAVVADESRRAWAQTPTGRSLVRRLGVLGAVLVALAAGSFSVWPPGGVYLLAAAGVVAYAAGAFAVAGALGLADAAVGRGASFARLVRAFWFAAAVDYRATRSAFAVALVAFGLAAAVAGVTVDPVVSAVGALALGGVFACLFAFGAVGVFVPGGHDDSVATAVRDAS